MYVKVCGLTRQADADAAISCGVGLCGFIFHKKSPRCISPGEASLITTGPMLRTGVFVSGGADEIAAAAEEARLDLIQLHGNQNAACADAVGARRVIRVVWPVRFAGNAQALQRELNAWDGHCLAFLFDAGTQGGGAGTPFDAGLLSGIRVPRPWFLAGGLGPGVTEVLAASRMPMPDGLDFNSGLEDAPGKKNAAKVRDVCKELRDAGLAPAPFCLQQKIQL